MRKSSIIAWFCLLSAAVAFRYDNVSGTEARPSFKNDKDQKVVMARADWDTGWFQAEIFKLMLTELGYEVKGPETMALTDFYPAVAQNEVDLWVNGWFPNSFFRDEAISRNVEAVGHEVKKGALQGYLIDKKNR